MQSLLDIAKACAGLTTGLLTACTFMPTVAPYSSVFSHQNEVTSASHWDYIAKDVVSGLAEVISTPSDKTCIRIHLPIAQGQPSFQEYLQAAIAKELLLRSKGQQNPFSSATVSSIISMPNSCNVITVRTAVVVHRGLIARTYPGKYTLLASGIVALKHVIRAYSDLRLLGSLAAGDVVFWATSGFGSGDTSTELTVTASYIGPSGDYLAEDTNVYYIDNGDKDLYEQKSNDAHLVDTLGSLYETSTSSARVPFGQLAGLAPNPPQVPTPGNSNSSEPVYAAIQQIYALEPARSAIAGLTRSTGQETPPATKTSPPNLESDVTVSPPFLLVCDPKYNFLVSGPTVDPDQDASAYLLGSLVAAQVILVKRARGDGSPTTVNVEFDNPQGFKDPPKSLPMTVVRTDGTIAGPIDIAVKGDVKACKASDKPATSSVSGATTGTSAKSSVSVTTSISTPPESSAPKQK